MQSSVEELRKIYLIRGIANIPFSLITAIPNALVLYLFWKDPKRTIRSSPTNTLVANLAVIDFLVGVVMQPIAAFWFLRASLHSNPPFESRHLQTIEALLILLSISSVLAISVDRYIGVTSPLRYSSRITKGRIRAGICCLWLYCIGLITSLQFLGKHYARNIIFCFHVDVVLIVTIVMFILVVHNLRRETTKMVKINASNQVITMVQKRRLKVTRTLSVVLGLFLLCCLPWVTMMQVYPLCQVCKNNMITFTWIVKMFFLIFQTNCAVNAFLGALRLPRYRQALGFLFPSVKRKLSFPSLSASQTPSNMAAAAREPGKQFYPMSQT